MSQPGNAATVLYLPAQRAACRCRFLSHEIISHAARLTNLSASISKCGCVVCAASSSIFARCVASCRARSSMHRATIVSTLPFASSGAKEFSLDTRRSHRRASRTAPFLACPAIAARRCARCRSPASRLCSSCRRSSASRPAMIRFFLAAWYLRDCAQVFPRLGSASKAASRRCSKSASCRRASRATPNQ
jgi:hypothetical protein